MSKNDMVMVSRELAEAILGNASQGYFSKDHGDALRAALKAQQHQGEPVAYLCKSEGAKWLQYGSKIGDPWKPGEVEVTPLYTHADPAEVERLRETLELVREQRDNELRTNSSLERERDSLRAQLAEAHALLVKANYVVDHSRTIDKQAFSRGTQNVDHDLFRGLGNLLAQYDEALPASAEPSAPVEIDERAEFEKQYGPGTWEHVLWSVERQVWMCRAALAHKP